MSHSTSPVSSTSTSLYPLAVQQRAVRSGTVGVIGDHQCGGCNKENASLRCGRCQAINYCNKDCQKAAWAAHKTVCKTIGQSSSTASTSSESVPPGPVENASVNLRAFKLLKLSEAAKQEGNFKKSIAHAEAALALKPTSPELIALLYIMISQSRRLRNLYDATTVDMCEKAVALPVIDPNVHAQACISLAETLIRVGRHEEACAATQRGFAVGPTKCDIVANLHIYTAYGHYNMGLFSEALSHAELGLTKNSQNLTVKADLYLISAMCRLSLGQRAQTQQDAEAGLEAALQTTHKSPDLIDRLNKILAKAK